VNDQEIRQPSHHFAGAGKMVDLGSGSVRSVDDYHLSRFACYLMPDTQLNFITQETV
jgi:DNA-damage-inducible protein D